MYLDSAEKIDIKNKSLMEENETYEPIALLVFMKL